MKDAKPFGIGGIWENWKDPMSGEWIRTFAVITTDANEMVAEIHDRMPLILAPKDYARWLSGESDPSDLMRPYPSAPMRMWPISTRVNKPENEDPSILANRVGYFGCLERTSEHVLIPSNPEAECKAALELYSPRGDQNSLTCGYSAGLDDAPPFRDIVGDKFAE